MATVIAPRWTGAEQTALQRAAADPAFQRLAIENGIALQHIQNWNRDHDVPVTARAGVRKLLSTWQHRQIGTP